LFTMKRFSTSVLLFAGLLTALVSFGTSSPASAAKLSPNDVTPSIGSLQLRVFDLSKSYFAPLTGARVLAWNQNGELTVKNLTDSKGMVSAKIPTGLYKVTVDLTGYTSTGAQFKINANKVTTLNIGLNPKSTPKADGFLLSDGVIMGDSSQVAASSPRLGDILSKVRITAYDGTNPTTQPIPIAGAFVTIMNSQVIVVTSGYTDNTGNFYAGLVPGQYRITITAKDFQSTSKMFFVKGGLPINMQMWMTK
jgi:hypothetical protein